MRRPQQGFTLIEVLVALTLMAVMAVMTWIAIDAMTRAQQATRGATDGVLTLQAGLDQWRADLDAMLVLWPQPTAGTLPSAIPPANAPAATRSLAWDGSVLRLTRAASSGAGDGARVVAWARRPATGQWLRWQSAPITSAGAWAAAWEAAGRWGQGGAPMPSPGAPEQAVLIGQITDWRLYYFRNNAWTNPLSSAAETASTGSLVPDGVRLVLTLAPGGALVGNVQMDWVRPTLGK